jgi:hypothetical protein
MYIAVGGGFPIHVGTGRYVGPYVVSPQMGSIFSFITSCHTRKGTELSFSLCNPRIAAATFEICALTYRLRYSFTTRSFTIPTYFSFHPSYLHTTALEPLASTEHSSYFLMPPRLLSTIDMMADELAPDVRMAVKGNELVDTPTADQFEVALEANLEVNKAMGKYNFTSNSALNVKLTMLHRRSRFQSNGNSGRRCDRGQQHGADWLDQGADCSDDRSSYECERRCRHGWGCSCCASKRNQYSSDGSYEHTAQSSSRRLTPWCQGAGIERSFLPDNESE